MFHADLETKNSQERARKERVMSNMWEVLDTARWEVAMGMHGLISMLGMKPKRQSKLCIHLCTQLIYRVP